MKTNPNLTIGQKEDFYRNEVTVATVAFVMMAIPVAIFVIDLMVFVFTRKVQKSTEIMGSVLLFILLIILNTVAGIIGLVVSGKSIYGFDCIVFETCEEIYRTFFTVYFWLIIGGGCAITMLLFCGCGCMGCIYCVTGGEMKLEMPKFRMPEFKMPEFKMPDLKF